MLKAKKLLVLLIAMVMVSCFFGTTVYASEQNAVEVPTEQNTTEDANNTTGNIEEQSSAVTSTENEQVIYITEDDLAIIDTYIPGADPVVDDMEEGTAQDAEDVAEDTTEEAEESEEVEEETEVKETEVKKPAYSKEDLRLLACLVYSEAGNQSYNGMLAVANVVLNRVKSDIYWHVDTIKEVIYDDKWSVQFAVTIRNSKGISTMDKALKCYDSGKYSTAGQKKSMERAIKASKAALEGKNNIGGYLCFQNKRSASSIKKKYSNYKIIGDHIFYRTK